MVIKLKKLSIVNFKGVRSLEIDFNHITNIFGDNATGKTSIFDAFLWLFFGKNSENVSDFEVKRLDEKNRFIKDLESEVSAIINIDQQEICIKKVLRQKWVKRRGELEAAYQGDENCYFWNDVPLKESEFKTKIKGIVDETLFRLITNPFYFNSLKWQERRNTLIEIAGNISNQEVLDSVMTVSNKARFTALVDALNAGKTIDEYKKEIAAKKKKIKDEAESIPSRIDEVRRGMPDEYNFSALQIELADLQKELNSINDALNDELALQSANDKARADVLKQHNEKVREHQQKVFSVKTDIQNIEFEIKQKAKESTGKADAELKSVNQQLDDKNHDKTRFENSIKNLKDQVTEMEANLQQLREDYEVIGSEEFKFDDHLAICPSCKQSLPEGDIDSKKEELTANFNRNKLSKMEAKKKEALALKDSIASTHIRIENGENKLAELNEEIAVLHQKIKTLKEAASTIESQDDVLKRLYESHDRYQSLKSELSGLEKMVFTEPVFEPFAVNESLKVKRVDVTNNINATQSKLNNEAAIDRAKKRITELEAQENKLAQELADFEGSEFSILEFTKSKVDAIERKINGKFKQVKFKMFDVQNNGGEVECCETLINGVPFSDANNAAKINAGIDIINTLCHHYDVYAPIFIDNRESVTKLIDSDSQIVNLIVSEADKKLRVA